MEKYQLEISYHTLSKIIIVIAVVVFLFLIRDVILAFFTAFVISTVINPLADGAEKRGFPRSFATVLIFLTILFFVGTIFYWILPPLIRDVTVLGSRFPAYLDENVVRYPFLEQYHLKENLDKLFVMISGFVRGQALDLFFSTVSFLGNLFYVFVTIAVSFYLTVDKNLIKNTLRRVFHKDHHGYLIRILEQIEIKIGKWLIGQIILSLVSSFIIFLGLSVLHVHFALFLAILAGILRFVPFIGGLVSDGLGILIAFLISPVLGIMTFLMYYLIQQLEVYIIIPYVMEKTVGLNPILVILAVISGGQINGIVGALLAVPVTIVLVVLVEELVLNEKSRAIVDK